MTRRLLLVSADPDLERHLSSVMAELCTVGRIVPAGDSFRRAAGEGASLIAIDADLAPGGGRFVAELVAQTAAAIPGVPLIVLGDESDPATVLRAVRAGARDGTARTAAWANPRRQTARHSPPAPPGPGPPATVFAGRLGRARA